jgi:hypothetical protein
MSRSSAIPTVTRVTERRPPYRSLRIAVLADSDTRWKWGAALARGIDPDCTLDAWFLHGRATPTERQLAEVGAVPDASRTAALTELLDEPRLADADVLVLALLGGAAQAALHGLARAWAGRERRPVVLTGYVGVVYEKLTEGLLLRAGADLVLANTAADAEEFRRILAAVGADPETVVETALPFLAQEQRGYTPDPSRPYTVVFAAQPSVPATRAERLHLLEQARRYALRHADHQVLIKLRSRPGEQTTHIEEHPYQRLLPRLTGTVPPNLDTAYGNMGELLDRTDLLATVSSTAALESLQRGIPTAILTDFGVREPLGNHWYLGSGCLASWAELTEGKIPVADPGWLRRHGVGHPDPYGELRSRIGELRQTALAPLRPHYRADVQGGYLPALLARYGLDAKGEPLPGRATTPPSGPVRRAVLRQARRTATSAYRLGAQYVAPAIRRWGQL